eukprot:483911_1
MLQDHLKRTARISRPVSSIPSKRKGTHWIVYIFLGIVMVIIITLLLVTYDFSIHQPSIDDTNINKLEDVIIDRKILKNLINGISNIGNNTNDNINNINDVSIDKQIEKWPLQTSNGDDCSGIFGNGYSREIISCSSNISSFKCIQNPFSNQIYCIGKNFIINPAMIQISNGGETIQSVAGRKEDDEFPKYKSNSDTGDSAFNINCSPQGTIPKKDGISYYFKGIIEFMRNIDMDIYHEKYISNYNILCKPNDDKLTIFLVTMRYEYANMYHQATDWYNFYQIIHSLDLIKNNNYEIIFFDGHAESQIDDAWEYGINRGNYKYNFIKQLNNGKLMCLNNVIFISAGYVGGISLKTVFKGCKKENKYIQNFSHWFLMGFGIKINTQRKDNNISITLICRKDYIAHPRNMIGKASRKFIDNKQIENIIKDIVNNMNENDIEFNIRNIAWSDYTFKQQLQIASSTDILIGVH